VSRNIFNSFRFVINVPRRTCLFIFIFPLIGSTRLIRALTLHLGSSLVSQLWSSTSLELGLYFFSCSSAGIYLHAQYLSLVSLLYLLSEPRNISFWIYFHCLKLNANFYLSFDSNILPYYGEKPITRWSIKISSKAFVVVVVI